MFQDEEGLQFGRTICPECAADWTTQGYIEVVALGISWDASLTPEGALRDPLKGAIVDGWHCNGVQFDSPEHYEVNCGNCSHPLDTYATPAKAG